MRLVPDRQGLACIDDETPQFGIAPQPVFQHRSIGKPMMKAALSAAWQHGYRKVSLTVHPDNPVRFICEACGFKPAGY
jgi:RimJ/RimL family protein N-acetyltransferase